MKQLFLGISAGLFACTGLSVEHVNGRTVEFGTPLEMSVAVIPRDYNFVGKTPRGKGLAYRSKYAAAGIYCFDDAVLMDGVNEKGLVAAAFYFPGYASYAEMSAKNQKQGLSPVDFPNWILSQFATVEEVKEALSEVVIAPTVLPHWGDAPPPMHYIVYDASGKSIVIEPVEHTLRVHDNPLGVITNSPTFDWHMTNLNNYINLTPQNVAPHKLGPASLTPLGQGTGLLGLPGDFTPPSRFVRAAFFATTVVPPKDDISAISTLFHLLNQFDIPLGAVREEKGVYDYTLLTSVKDVKGLRYYYRSYANQAIEYVDLSSSDLRAKEIKARPIRGAQKAEDVSSLLRI